jgi:hypothetical protein
MPRKDKSINLVKTYEFQFFDNLETLQSTGQKIQNLIDTYQVVPEDIKDRYRNMLATGFTEWSL